MRCALLLVFACSHREPAKSPPPPPPLPAPVADATRPDASIPTATGDWKRGEVETPREHQTIGETIRAQQATLRRCHEKGAKAPTSVVLTVGSDGTVTAVHFHDGDHDIDDCIEKALRGMHFDEASVEVMVPFTE